MRIGDNRTKLIFLSALATGLVLSLIVKPEVIISLFELTRGEQYPLYGVMVWEVDRAECRFYDTEQLLPRGYESMFDKDPQECGSFDSQMLRRRLQLINETTNSTEVKTLIEEAYTEIENYNYERAQEIASRIEVNRTYSVK